MLKKSILRYFADEKFTLKLSSFSPHELSRVVLRAVKEKRSDISFWKCVIARANAIADQLQPYDISVIVYGLGRMRYRDKDLLLNLAARSIPHLSAMSLNDISHLLAGFARVEVRNDLLFDLASREIGKKLNTCKSLAEISNILCSYVSLNYEHPLLFSALGKRTIFLLPLTKDCPSREFSTLVESFAKSEYEDPKLFALFSSEICRRMDELTVVAIARISSAFSKRGLLGENLFLNELILDECFKRRMEFDAVSASLLLHSVIEGEAKSKISLLAEYFIADFSRKGVGKFDLSSLALLASALGRYHVIEGSSGPTADETKLFISIGDKVAGLADQLDQSNIALLVRGFADVGVRHGPFLFNVPNHVKGLVDEMSLCELGMVFKGYADFAIRNDVLLDCVPPRVSQLLESPEKSIISVDEIYTLANRVERRGEVKKNASAVLDILESLAILMVSQKRLADSLVEYLDHHKELLTDKDLLERLPKSVNMLRSRCPESLLLYIKERSTVSTSTLALDQSVQGELKQLLANRQRTLVT